MNKNLIRWAKEKLPIVIADNSTEDLQQITSARQWSIHAGVGTHVVSNQILNEGKAVSYTHLTLPTIYSV